MLPRRGFSMLKLMISGGGTGGHIFPAIAIANEIKSRMPDADILFVGALGKMEMEKVPQAGYPITGLSISGFQRDSVLKNLLLPYKLVKSIFASIQLIKKFKPAFVIGVGGYASGPLLLAAQLLGVPTYLQEQNSLAGKTNVWLGKRARKICVAYPNMEKYFPANKIVLTGNPVRKEILEIKNIPRLSGWQGIEDDRSLRILVTGGSLGARNINRAMSKNIDWFMQANVSVLWQTGVGYYPTAETLISSRKPKNILATAFVKDMHNAYAWADLVVSRAGAGAIAEIMVAGKCAVLVPLPTAAEDHQTKNAEAITNSGAGILVSDAAIENSITEIINRLLSQPDEVKKMGMAAAGSGRTDATKKIADIILNDAQQI